MSYLIIIICIVCLGGLFAELGNVLFGLELREKCSRYFVRRFMTSDQEVKKMYVVSLINRLSLAAFSAFFPYFFTYVRRTYTGYDVVEVNPVFHLAVPIIILIIASILVMFYISTLWHSAHVVEDSIIFVPINPFSTFSVSADGLFMAKGTRNTQMGLSIYQVYNAEQDRWYYCLLGGLEELGLGEKIRKV